MRACMVFLALCLILAVGPGNVRTATAGTAATVTPAGRIALPDGTVIPQFPGAGAWTELAPKASDRYEIQHFLYGAPGEAPVLELFVTTDKRGESPDGAFEMGLIKGFLSGFAPRAGLRYREPDFDNRVIGAAWVKHTLVKLSDDRVALWVHVYIYPRMPSLTFLAIRVSEGGERRVEEYLAAAGLR